MSLCYDNDGAELCIVGRFCFQYGIGAHTYAFCELLSRSYPVCVLPTEPHLRQTQTVALPNGRQLPVCRDPSSVKVWLFVDVLWNGTHDVNYHLVPSSGLRIACIVFDSNELPMEWVDILNDRFDICLVFNKRFKQVVRSSGVTIPTAILPLALDIEGLLARPFVERIGPKTRFLSIGAFHPRKQHDTLIQAFIAAFGDRQDVELRIHSNLEIEGTFERLQRLVAAHGASNIVLSNRHLNEKDRDELIAACDVFANCSRGEGYSIGPRQAMAMGKLLVLSGVDAHLDLAGSPGVFIVEPTHRYPARYPEIENRVFGVQSVVLADDVAQALRRAKSALDDGMATDTRSARRSRAASFSFSRLAGSYAELLDPALRRFRSAAPAATGVSVPEEVRAPVIAALGCFGAGFSHTSRRIIQSHDGGYYSIFNAFFSHLVWDQYDERCRLTLPDWDAARMIKRLGTDQFTSFCYASPTDGNSWLHLYEPLFGLSDAEMNSESFLYHNASLPDVTFNELREPKLTYIHAYRLYHTPQFAAWRRQYHNVFKHHVRLRAGLQAEVDSFAEANLQRPLMIAAHVRHPSHSLEQPGNRMAHTQAYIDKVREEVSRKGIALESDDWGVFLATDQDQVVDLFRATFGERVCCFEDVRRTRQEEDLAYGAQSQEARSKEGHQVQHIMAKDPASWSTRLAWEIVRDAHVMARCHSLLHVVSNVSTAVSYMNPAIDLVFVD